MLWWGIRSSEDEQLCTKPLPSPGKPGQNGNTMRTDLIDLMYSFDLLFGDLFAYHDKQGVVFN
jgi:hypothetical protein